MALVTEDGTGKTDAESYASVADADAYFVGRTGATAWAAAADTAAKEKALRDATDYLEERYNTRWLGRKTNETQALAWPRAYLTTYDDFAIESDSMPTKVKRACMEMAVRALSEDILPDITAGANNILEESATVGSLSKTTKYSGTSNTLKTYRVTDMLLREFILGQSVQRA